METVSDRHVRKEKPEIEPLSDGPCPFCDPEQCTPWHFRDMELIVLDCRTCGRPIVLQRAHGPWCLHALARGVLKARELFGDCFRMRMDPAAVLEHAHFHVHPADDGEAAPPRACASREG